MWHEKGQALLIVILTMVVSLTVGLSLASRSLVNVRISQAEEESQRAFFAAEAGIEEALKSGAAIGSATNPLTLPNNARYFATVATIGGTEFELPGIIVKDEGGQIWLSTHPTYASPYLGSVTIFWGEEGESCPNASALEISVFEGSTSSPSVRRFAVDPCTRGNSFQVASGGGLVLGKQYRSSTTILGITSGLIMRIVPLYRSTSVAVRGSASLPSQGKLVESVGKVPTSEGKEVVRKIKVFESFPTLPTFFDYAIFGGTSL